MRTLILAVALTAIAPVMGYAQSPSWQTNYATAQQKAIEQQRPLAVVFGQGANGQQQLTGGAITNDANRTLADRYISCYVDTSTPAGQQLAQRFGINGSTGLVISDRTGNLQAFWHQGNLPADALSTCLTRYSDPQRPVTTTDTNVAGSQTSLYPPTAPFAGNPYEFASYQGMGGMGGSAYGMAGGCASGNCGGGYASMSCASGNCGGGQAMGGCGGGKRHGRGGRGGCGGGRGGCR